jgi:3-oxoacyl-[acyl-carrier protein] reductase
VNYRADAAAAAATVAACRAAGGDAVPLPADAADADAMAAAVADLERAFGPIAWCVANAGLVRDRLVWDTAPDDFDAVVRGNLGAGYATLRAVLPGLAARRAGSMVVLSSVSSAVANPGQSAYAAAKAELNALARGAAREVAPQGVRVNAVLAGLVATEATAAMTDRQRERALARVALARMAEPAEIAAVVHWLLDDARAGYVTGACLAVDGGMGAA